MKALEKVKEIKYPRFIIDKPEGKDLFDGQSQNRIAENIAQFLTENDESKRKVIGIEGEWGSGKSNVIEILKNKLHKDYYFFVFDAWGHQEDLTRRSILEGLLIKLIKDDILTGDKDGWGKKLKNLLSRKVEKQQRSVPQLSSMLILSLAAILLIPISLFFAGYYLKLYTTTTTSPTIGNYGVALLISIIPYIPLLYKILRALYKNKSGKKLDVIGELFYIYKGKEIENISQETISENEPTVGQFIKFLTNIEDDSNKKLVIVFDNMDRLPATKVKEVWSSIHTFFASDDNDLKTWAIVPFDNEHICNIFIEDSDSGTKDRHRADSYIHKTFSIVFHVSPPVLSDWKDFLNKKFEEAFGVSLPSEERVETIFDYYHSADPKIKPRDIICYINDIVALKKLWPEKISFKYLALFALKRTEILENPFEEILSKNYLAALNPLFAADEQLETNISALAFNVPIEKADEILLKRPIEKALKGEGDLIILSKHKSFFDVFDSVFYNLTYENISTISCLNAIPEDIAQNPKMNEYWEYLADEMIKINAFEIKYLDPIKVLANKLKAKAYKEKILKFLFVKAIDHTKNTSYKGEGYFNLIKDIDALVKGILPGKSVMELLSANNVEADEYFEFVNSCPENYHEYKVTCEVVKINEYLIGKFSSHEISQLTNQLKAIRRKVDLSGFINYINGIIPTILPTLAEYPLFISDIYTTGKILFKDDGRFLFDIPESIAIPILATNGAPNNKVDLLLSIIKTNISNPLPDHATNPACKAMFDIVDEKEQIIESYRYYFNYSDLLKYYLQFPCPLIKAVIKELTSNTSSVEGNDVGFLIGKYDEIGNKIFGSKIDLRNSFISKVDSFYSSNGTGFVTTESLSNIATLIDDNGKIENNLIMDIISQANKFLTDLNKDQWIKVFKEYETSDIIELFASLIECEKYKGDKLPQPADNAYSEVIESIAKKEIEVPKDNNDFWDLLFNMRISNHTHTFKNVRDELLFHTHGPVTIEELSFFEKGLFKFGGLDETIPIADDTLRRILIPLASSDEKYMTILKQNAGIIKNIIVKANDSIIEFKSALDSHCKAILDDTEFKGAADILIEKFNELSPKPVIEENKIEDTLPSK